MAANRTYVPGNPQGYYGIQLLDDLHTYFPDVLYNPRRFLTVQSLLAYIQEQTRNQFDLFGRAQRQHLQTSPPSVQQPRRGMTVPRGADPMLDPISTLLSAAAAIPEPPVVAPVQHQIPVTVRVRPGEQDRTMIQSLFRMQQPLDNNAQTVDFLSRILNLGTTMGFDEVNINANFMEPVPVVPSQEQIESATTLRGATNADETAACSICQDTFASGQAIRRIHQCNHEFHRGCIDTWFQTNVHCPMCRCDIRETSRNLSG